jgi:hypothetical protein
MITRRKAIVGGLTAGAAVGASPRIAVAGNEPSPPPPNGSYSPNSQYPALLSDTYLTLNFIPINPYRSLDTRTNVFGRQYRDDPTLQFNVLTDLRDVPQFPQELVTQTFAVSYNLTVTATEGNNGFLTVYPAALTSVPNVSSINWTGPGLDLANGGTVALIGETTNVKIVCGGPTAAVSAHVLLDITGIYVNSIA